MTILRCRDRINSECDEKPCGYCHPGECNPRIVTLHQADCEACGWHTIPTADLRWVQNMAANHACTTLREMP